MVSEERGVFSWIYPRSYLEESVHLLLYSVSKPPLYQQAAGDTPSLTPIPHQQAELDLLNVLLFVLLGNWDIPAARFEVNNSHLPK